MLRKTLLLMTLFLLCVSARGNASMIPFITYTAEGAGISIDALGVADNTDGIISSEIPVGASIYGAYLYSASVWSSSLKNVLFDGNTLVSDASSRLDVGGKDANAASENRWDVTSIVQSKVGGGSGLFNFTVKELGYLDGEILAVLYNVPSDPVQTAFIFDGELATAGDSFNINLTTPFSVGDDVIMSLGISYGYQGSVQYTEVDVNGQRLTSSAGGEDDGIENQNGGLITAGGIGDSIANPANPLAGPGGDRFYDDELYNLAAFLNEGATLITIDTLNPSADDNVFFMGLTTLGEASAGPSVPEPATIFLLGSGLIGLVGLGRKKLFKRG